SHSASLFFGLSRGRKVRGGKVGDFSAAGLPDVVIDCLTGVPMSAFLRYLAGAKLDTSRPVRYVQVGNMACDDAAVPAVLLSRRWSMPELLGELPAMVEALPTFGVRAVDKIGAVDPWAGGSTH
ncbi:hypothetical protein HK405_004948, partial [Cladochytrium tenue]